MEAAHPAPARSGRMNQQRFSDMSEAEFDALIAGHCNTHIEDRRDR
jgi:hypothetical protein